MFYGRIKAIILKHARDKDSWVLIVSNRLQMNGTALQKHTVMKKILFFILVSFSPDLFERLKFDSWGWRMSFGILPHLPGLFHPAPFPRSLLSAQHRPRDVMKAALFHIWSISWSTIQGPKSPWSLPGTNWLPDNCLVSRQGPLSFQRTFDVKRSLFITSGEATWQLCAGAPILFGL